VGAFENFKTFPFHFYVSGPIQIAVIILFNWKQAFLC